MNNLSKREKFLLLLLALVAITYIGISFFIQPKIDAIKAIESQIEEAKVTQTSMKAKLLSLENTEITISKMTDEIESYTKEYYASISKNEIGTLILNVLANQNLVPISLVITEPKEVILPTSDSNNVGKKSSKESKKDTSIFTVLPVKKSVVLVQVKGSITQLNRILQELESLHSHSIRISSFYIDGDTTDPNQPLTMSIDFEVFIYDKTKE